MSLQSNLNMKSKESGLTVGELTIAIGALIIVGILWTAITKKDSSKESFNKFSDHSLAIRPSEKLSANSKSIHIKSTI